MADTTAETPVSSPNLTLNNIGQFVCDTLQVPGCIVLTSNSDGTIGFTGSGVNNIRANEMLSVGIHINLSQHDARVLAGLAGKEAREAFEAIQAAGNDGGVPQ